MCICQKINKKIIIFMPQLFDVLATIYPQLFCKIVKDSTKYWIIDNYLTFYFYYSNIWQLFDYLSYMKLFSDWMTIIDKKSNISSLINIFFFNKSLHLFPICQIIHKIVIQLIQICRVRNYSTNDRLILISMFGA